MKLFEWKVLLSQDADNCKHHKFTCECGTMIYRHKKYTKADQLKMARGFRRLKKLQEALGEDIEE